MFGFLRTLAHAARSIYRWAASSPTLRILATAAIDAIIGTIGDLFRGRDPEPA